MSKFKKPLIIISSVIGALVVLVLAAIYFVRLNNFHIELSLKGQNAITLEYGQKYQEMGAEGKFYGKWIHKNGKILDIKTEGTVDDAHLGTYTVKYTASYKKYLAEITRTVTVVDTVAPELTLSGDAEIEITKGKEYEEPGFSAIDNYDGDITASVTVTGQVDNQKAGEYILTYSLSDSSGNKTEKTRKITVKEPPKPKPVTTQQSPSIESGDRVVYLTFDDGPGPYTAKLLDVLDKYNVKATFFVCNKSNYLHLLKDMADRGHAIAIHSATHDYDQIYSSEQAFFDDIYKMQNIIKEYTGITTYLLRFPGGSSNTISKFNPGIMTRLTAQVVEKGFRFFDWNVTSGDAGETESTQQVAKNVINGMAKHNVSVVLQHDIKNFSVNAVEEIIKWGLDNGYTFKTCDMTSPTAQHGVNN